MMFGYRFVGSSRRSHTLRWKGANSWRKVLGKKVLQKNKLSVAARLTISEREGGSPPGGGAPSPLPDDTPAAGGCSFGSPDRRNSGLIWGPEPNLMRGPPRGR